MYLWIVEVVVVPNAETNDASAIFNDQTSVDHQTSKPGCGKVFSCMIDCLKSLDCKISGKWFFYACKAARVKISLMKEVIACNK